MKTNQNNSVGSTQPGRRQSPFQRIDQFLEHNHEHSNAQKIRLMRQVYFADVDALQKSGKLILPK